MNRRIFTINSKKDEEFLRRPTKKVGDVCAPEISKLIKEMREMMIKNNGVGLASNQIGEDKRILVIQLDGRFFALVNPEIIKYSIKKVSGEEGCLSVPGVVGIVDRSHDIVIKGFDESGKKIKIKAKDALARVFQHEYDHLDGILFIDKTSELYKVTKQVD